MREHTRIRTMRAAMGAGLVLALAGAAAAHPGHGLAAGSEHWLHYVSEPLHVAPLALTALALVLTGRRWRESRARASRR